MNVFKAKIRVILASDPFDVRSAEILSTQIHQWERNNPTEELSYEDEYLWGKLTEKIIDAISKQ